MNRVHTILAIAVIAAITIGWRLWYDSPPHGAAPPGVLQTGSAGATNVEPAPEPTPHPDPLSEPEPLAQAGNPGSKVVTAKLLEQHGCYVTDQSFDPDTGDYRDVYTCPSRQPEAHTYESWSDETLASLAYGDHEAAAVLGLRHLASTDPQQEALGLSLLYRSVALSGDPEVFHRAIGHRYAYLSINGEPQLHNLKQLLLFSLIGSRLGGKDFDPKPVELKLRATEVPPQELSHLRDVADQILQTMASLQTEITGNTSIAEVIADA